MNSDPQDDRPAKARPAPVKPTRDQRLKAALKANMARRKAQARAKAAGGDAPDPADENGAVRDGGT